MSILHRATGVILIPAVKLLILWLGAIAMGQDCYEQFVSFCAHPIAIGVFMGLVFCFFFYTFNNIRHVFWDFGKGFELNDVYRSAWAIIYPSFIATALVGTILFIIIKGQ